SICQPRVCGVLGFQHLEDQSSSFPLKLGFNIATKDEALWVQVLRSKYGMKERLPESITQGKCSAVWRALAKMVEDYFEVSGTSTCKGFLMASIQASLLTNVEISWRGIRQNSSSLSCRHGIGDLLRVLRDCPTAKKGVAYSQDGQWIAGYNRYLGFCSVFDVELWRILDRLVFIQREGHKRVLIHTDNLEAVKAVQDIHSTEANSALVKRIHMTLQTIEQ
ncbi:hypothetical protein Goshw_024923, partial [Gossypium schwendimanii]|nr:hypothetical protein [Gossypium schwendimanii]